MKDKILQIINHYGIDKQLKYIHSEYFELDETIIKYEDYAYENYDYGIGKVEWGKWREHIAEEIADVMVMLKQFQYYYGIENKEIEEIMEYKINRQLERIEKEEGENNENNE